MLMLAVLAWAYYKFCLIFAFCLQFSYKLKNSWSDDLLSYLFCSPYIQCHIIFSISPGFLNAESPRKQDYLIHVFATFAARKENKFTMCKIHIRLPIFLFCMNIFFRCPCASSNKLNAVVISFRGIRKLLQI